jgi:hypothetical protein
VITELQFRNSESYKRAFASRARAQRWDSSAILCVHW